MEFCDECDLAAINTFFTEEKKHRSTYRSGQESTQVDYILVKKGDRKYVEDCKVIRGEYQHSLLVAVMQERKLVNQTRKSYRPTRKTWLLNKQASADKFKAKVKEKWTGCSDNVDDTWLQYKKCVLEAADEVCGWTKGRREERLPGGGMKDYEM